ncbi:MAG: [acyl-carrier-protein] S-malonyltransferase [Gemmataceae bacterium]|nr:[acyl-carrier-protein] S-malonyltransferase [Gemmataceae bacterium]
MSQTAILFPGQGAQYVGMGVALAEKYASVQSLYDKAAQILGFNLLEICKNGPAERINATDISQPALFVASFAALHDLEQTEPEALAACAMTAGLSLGEYSALAFAGAIDFETGLKLVHLRGTVMQMASEKIPSTMASILLLDESTLEELVRQAQSKGLVRIANYLCPGNLVISGVIPAVQEVERLAQAAGGKTIRLSVAGAFHTSVMDPAMSPLSDALKKVGFVAPRIPVFSNVTGVPHSTPESISELLAKQVVEPVRWEACIRQMIALGVDKFYEVGPGRILAGLLKRIDRKLPCVNIAG